MMALLYAMPPLPSSPTGGEGPDSTRFHRHHLSHPGASLPPVWGRVGVGGPFTTPKATT